MTESSGQPQGLRAGATAVVNESYSFVCMRCGFGWEQSYEIEHHTRADGGDLLVYVADGAVVPSPLNRPVCGNCDGHLVRIMRPGRVASARGAADREHPVPAAGPVEVPQPERQHRHEYWHLSALLRGLRGAH
ncbi:hypothetical protein G3I31_19220 [Streptomyces sp. SID9913]|uniref:hypothetical protein n=1 Tax=Streptomyces sp. SID9913 TaxID=2706117 RepID=UPI0013DD83DB|nr:hypothetical protein [Streptomyces sp. SID9913]MBM7092321.1 hypothetical protein [Streptomyces sp. S12]NED20206.1 hypothetical protein [Streptomyces sp. SID9913]